MTCVLRSQRAIWTRFLWFYFRECMCSQRKQIFNTSTCFRNWSSSTVQLLSLFSVGSATKQDQQRPQQTARACPTSRTCISPESGNRDKPKPWTQPVPAPFLWSVLQNCRWCKTNRHKISFFTQMLIIKNSLWHVPSAGSTRHVSMKRPLCTNMIITTWPGPGSGSG